MKTAISIMLSATLWLGLPCPGAAGSLSEAPVVFRTGKWTVRRSVGSFSGDVKCTGVYDNNFSVQVTSEKLFFGTDGKGEPQLVGWRYDNGPVQDRLTTNSEKRLSTIIWKGRAFTELSESRHLRVQIYTVLGDLVDFDVDTSNIRAVIQNIRSGCPTTVDDAGRPQSEDRAGPHIEPLYKRTPEGYQRVN